MFGRGKIITISINPAWDIECMVDGIDWGDHKIIDRQNCTPAGKALNVSRALAYMGYTSVAAGLWGSYDYDDMLSKLRPLSGYIDIRFTVVNGRTRRNVSISDTRNNRQMHLRLAGSLATKPNVKKFIEHLLGVVDAGDVCVFAGSLPDGSFADEIVSAVWDCKAKEAEIVLDSSGKLFSRLIDTKQVDIISPNIQELAELVGTRVKPEINTVTRAARKMLEKVNTVIVSMDAAGALLVNRDGYWHSELKGVPMPVIKTVGCGDNLLAGIIAGMHEDPDPGYALAKGVRLATAYAYGICETNEIWELDEKISVETNYHKF